MQNGKPISLHSLRASEAGISHAQSLSYNEQFLKSSPQKVEAAESCASFFDSRNAVKFRESRLTTCTCAGNVDSFILRRGKYIVVKR